MQLHEMKTCPHCGLAACPGAGNSPYANADYDRCQQWHALTPYQRHEGLGHHMARHSPNGVDIIEECSDCGARFLHNPCFDFPISLSYVTVN